MASVAYHGLAPRGYSQPPPQGADNGSSKFQVASFKFTPMSESRIPNPAVCFYRSRFPACPPLHPAACRGLVPGSPACPPGMRVGFPPLRLGVRSSHPGTGTARAVAGGRLALPGRLLSLPPADLPKWQFPAWGFSPGRPAAWGHRPSFSESRIPVPDSRLYGMMPSSQPFPPGNLRSLRMGLRPYRPQPIVHPIMSVCTFNHTKEGRL